MSCSSYPATVNAPKGGLNRSAIFQVGFSTQRGCYSVAQRADLRNLLGNLETLQGCHSSRVEPSEHVTHCFDALTSAADMNSASNPNKQKDVNFCDLWLELYSMALNKGGKKEDRIAFDNLLT